MEKKRRRRKQADGLRMLVGVLAVLLVAVICMAIWMGGKQEHPAGPTTGTPSHQTNPSVSGKLTVQPESDLSGFTMADTVVFTGSSDPAAPLTVNGESVERNADGSFRREVKLQPGKNEILFAQGNDKVSFTVERRYVVERYAPAADQSLSSGATLTLEVSARDGSTVTAQFQGQTVSLQKTDRPGNTKGFFLYTATVELPSGNTEDQNLGAVTFTASCDGITENYTGGTVTCLKKAPVLNSDPSVTPNYGDYIDVGSGYIAEVIHNQAETFDGSTADDYSHPTNSYLPKGTVDYCSQNVVQVGNLKYVTLRCGRRIYVDKRNVPESKRTKVTQCYEGSLPDHNELSFAGLKQEGHHTVLLLDTLWKAPFYFDLLPQKYAAPNGGDNRDYAVTSCTATYVEITFCYATSFTGNIQIPADHPLFASAELTQNQSDCTLRLNLKKAGGFYGWDCYYNDNGQLCFQFLNPVSVSKANNAYGADLTGVTILIDVGHGGVDGGAEGKDSTGKTWYEAERNLALAKTLGAQLESIGATVLYNRTDNSTLSTEDRIWDLRQKAPDLCIAVHQNSIAGYPEVSGFESDYYTPFSQPLAKAISDRTKAAGIYKKFWNDWHIYYMARQTVCPVVLTENGFLTNAHDLSGQISQATLEKKAQAITQGIVDYYLSFNQ